MLRYEEFRERAYDRLQELFDDIGAEVFRHKVEKTNRWEDGITIQTDSPISPTMYMSDLYQRYLQFEDFEDAVESYYSKFVIELERLPSVKDAIRLIKDDDEFRDHVIFHLVNTKQNQDKLAEAPHRELGDLSIIYSAFLEMEGGVGTVCITDAIADLQGVDEETLYELAYENTRRLLPPVMKSMQDVMRDYVPEDCDMGEAPDLYVYTNERGIKGAVNILYKEKMQELADALDENLLIIPSSTEEVLLLPESAISIEHAAAMVYEVNQTQVEIGERLSNQVYLYDKDTQEITMASNTPHQSLVYETDPEYYQEDALEEQEEESGMAMMM